MQRSTKSFVSSLLFCMMASYAPSTITALFLELDF